MPPETVTTNEREQVTGVSEVAPDREEDALRAMAVRHLEHIRKFKLYLFTWALALVVLTPVWAVTQYETADGWPKHLSTRSRYPGDWDPWIIWVVLIGGAIVALAGYRVHVDRSDTEAEVEREVERLKSR